MRVDAKRFVHALKALNRERKHPEWMTEVIQFYTYGKTPDSLELTADGNPYPQLFKDGQRLGNQALLAAVRRLKAVESLVLLSQEQLTEKGSLESFPASLRRILAAAGYRMTELLVVSLERGVSGDLDPGLAALVEDFRQAYRQEVAHYREVVKQTGVKGYKELSLFTFVGFAGGLVAGWVLDLLGLSQSALGEWFVRTLSGEGEAVAEGAYVAKSRLARRRAEAVREEEGEEEGGLVWFETEAAEAYGMGKVAGMAVPWVVDAVSRAAGVDVRAPEGTYVAYLYSLADQIGANLSGLRYHIKRSGSLTAGLSSYVRDPVMMSSLAVIVGAPITLYLVRSAGFRPDQLVQAALEGILLNLCWVPPLTAWFWDRSLQQGLGRLTQEYVAKANLIQTKQ